MKAWRIAWLVGWIAFAQVCLAGVEAGFVEDYEGEPTRYRLERAGVALPVAVLTPLQPGDRLSVRDAEGRIRLRLGRERSVTLTAADGVFEVGAADESATVVGNLARWAMDWAGAGGQSSGSRIPLTTRGLGLALPLCPPDVAQRLPSTLSELRVAWLGGRAPYSLHVLRDDAALAEMRDLADSHAILALASAVPPGPARLVLEDADGESVSVVLSFEASADDATPRSGDGFTELLAAFEILERDGAAGRLAAYQSLDASTDYAPAQRVREALLRGE